MDFMRIGTPMLASFAATRNAMARTTRPRNSHRYGRRRRMTRRSVAGAVLAAGAEGAAEVLLMGTDMVQPAARHSPSDGPRRHPAPRVPAPVHRGAKCPP